MITLLQRDDIKKFTTVPEYMSGCEFIYLDQVEVSVFRKCLGNDLYETLKEDLTDLSGIIEWSPLTSYIIGNKVKYKGTYYEALVNNVNSAPVNPVNWEVLDRFTTECYNDLWCDYLGQFLSTIVLKRHLPTISVKVNAAGINRSEGETYDKATRSEILELRAFLDGMVSEIYKNMSLWMIETNEGCFDDFMGINKNVCKNCGCTLSEDCTCDCKRIFKQRGRMIVA